MSAEIPHNTGRFLYSLDLAERSQGKSAFWAHSVKHLDLAAPFPMSQTAKAIDSYTKRAEAVLCPLFPSSATYVNHKFILPNSAAATCEVTQERIEGALRDYTTSTDYNGLHVVTDFITFFNALKALHPEISSAEAFRQFVPDSRHEALEDRGGTCVSKAHHIVEVLQRDFSLEAHVIVESEGPDAPPTHAAVAVPCADGILLIEAEHQNLVIPLKPNDRIEFPRGDGTPTIPVAFKIVQTPGHYLPSVPFIEKTVTEDGKSTVFQYLLRPAAKPDLSVMKRWMVSENFYPLSSGTHAGKQTSIKVNMKRNTVTFQIENAGEKPKKARLPLAAFDGITDWAALDKSLLTGDEGAELTPEDRAFFLSSDFFNGFHSTPALLQHQIMFAAQNRAIIQELLPPS